MLERRLAARLIDIAILALPSFFALAIAAGVAISLAWDADLSVGEGLVVLLLAMSVTFLPIMLYEVALTARSGQTRGKDALSIMVVRHDDGQLPTAAAAFIRWIVPAVAIVAGAVVVAMIPVPKPQGLEDWVPVAGGLVAWLLVYASSMWDADWRGWHDKAAGTVVVNEPQPHARPTQPNQAARKSGAGVADATTPQGSQQSSGLVSDYYAPRRPPRPESDEPEPT